MGLATLDPDDLPVGAPPLDEAEAYAAEIAAGLRQPRDRRAVGREVVRGGASWWVGKSRAALAAEAEARAHEMSQTAVGRSVKAPVNTP